MNELLPSVDMGLLDEDFDFDSELIKQNHLEVDLLLKRGVKVRKPMWDGLIAS